MSGTAEFREKLAAMEGVCVYEQGHVEHVDAIDRLTDRAPVTSFMRLPDGRMLLAPSPRHRQIGIRPEHISADQRDGN